jgi:hypothetical protein
MLLSLLFGGIELWEMSNLLFCQSLSTDSAKDAWIAK